MRVLFFGSDRVSLVALKKLANTKDLINQLDVVCPIPVNYGRGKSLTRVGEVREFAIANHLKIFDAPPRTSIKPAANLWSPTPHIIQQNYDLGIVVSFAYFLPREVIGAFPSGALNLHPSLLPKYRGAAPIQRTLMNGDNEAGVSIIKVHPEKFDAGGVVKQSRTEVSTSDTFSMLAERLVNMGADDLISAIKDIKNGTSKVIEQDKSLVSQAPKITDEDRKMAWGHMSASTVWNYWRGLNENGGVFASFRDKRIKLIELGNPSMNDINLKPTGITGSLHIHDNRLFVECMNATFVECLELQIEGKVPIQSKPFIHGYCKNASVSFS